MAGHAENEFGQPVGEAVPDWAPVPPPDVGDVADHRTFIGAVIDEGMHGKVRVTVIATGFDRALRRERREREDLELDREREPVSGGFDVPADVLEVPSFLRRR